ncbi:MAG: hypothetical protein Harvfovirus14_10 [Harvfovirus sp.]|uniref:Uncharacterized protein n=1 Tax=Harvfovirus sp. TaxID=2487768 RepID=A0A3G5A6D0_9VIRU|nr:MAG: hypothetical protein Harvfovirus14_10 [Harvfovirus sp.]
MINHWEPHFFYLLLWRKMASGVGPTSPRKRRNVGTANVTEKKARTAKKYDDFFSRQKNRINSYNAEHLSQVINMNKGNHGECAILDGPYLRTLCVLLKRCGRSHCKISIVEKDPETIQKMRETAIRKRISPTIIPGKLVDIMRLFSNKLSYGYFDFQDTKITPDIEISIRRFFELSTDYAVLCVTFGTRSGEKGSDIESIIQRHKDQIKAIAKEVNKEIYIPDPLKYRRTPPKCEDRRKHVQMLYYEIFIGKWGDSAIPISDCRFSDTYDDEKEEKRVRRQPSKYVYYDNELFCRLCQYQAKSKALLVAHRSGKKHREREGPDLEDLLKPIIE